MAASVAQFLVPRSSRVMRLGWNGFVDRSERRAPTPSSIAGVSYLAVRWAVLLVVSIVWLPWTLKRLTGDAEAVQKNLSSQQYHRLGGVKLEPWHAASMCNQAVLRLLDDLVEGQSQHTSGMRRLMCSEDERDTSDGAESRRSAPARLCVGEAVGYSFLRQIVRIL